MYQNKIAETDRNEWKRLVIDKLDASIMFVLFIIAFAVRVYNLSQTYINPDEIIYTRRAAITMGSDWNWRYEFMWDQPPMFIYILAVLMNLTDGSLSTLRLFSVLSGAVSVPLLYVVGKSMFTRRTASIAAFLLAIDGMHVLYSRLTYIEAIDILLLLLSVFFYWEYIVKRQSTKHSVIGGVVLGLAQITKYISLVIYPVFFLFGLVFERRAFFSKKFLLFTVFSVLVFVPVGLALLVNRANPFWFLFAQWSYWQSPVTQAKTALQGSEVLLNPITYVLIHVAGDRPWETYPSYTAYSGLATIVLVLALLAGAYGLATRQRSPAFALIGYAAFTVFYLVYPSRRPYHMLYALPFVLLLIGFMFDRALAGISSLRRLRLPYKVLALLAVGLTLTYMGMTAIAVPAYSRPGFSLWDSFTEAMNSIDRMARSGDQVATPYPYIALYIISQYNLSLNVLPMENVVYWPSLTADERLINARRTPIGPSWFQTYTLEPIIENHPRFIVLDTSNFRFQFTSAMRSYLFENYVSRFTTGRVWVFERKPGLSPEIVSAAEASEPPVSVDFELLRSGVPPVLVAENKYQARVNIRNEGQDQIQVQVVADYPIDSVIVDPPFQTASLPPKSDLEVRFLVVPYRVTSRPLVMSFSVSPLGSAQFPISPATLKISQIVESPSNIFLQQLSGVVAISTMLGVTAFIARRKVRRNVSQR